MQKFHKIGQFHDAVSYARRHAERYAEPVTFTGTVKLHGTNAGVRIGPDGYEPQSRNRTLTADSDNMGWYAFATRPAVKDVLTEIAGAYHARYGADVVTIFGEWSGPGIQKGVALNDIPARMFVVFAIAVDGEYVPVWSEARYDDVGVRWAGDVPAYRIVIDLLDSGSCMVASGAMGELVDAVEAICPWGKVFGVDGIGEGIVWAPVGRLDETEIWFKTKGQAHRKSAPRKKGPPAFTPEHLDSAREFVDMMLTDARLEQGLEVLREMGHPIEMRSTGHYLKWVGQDVSTEGAGHLEASGLDWKPVSRMVSQRARLFFVKAVARHAN